MEAWLRKFWKATVSRSQDFFFVFVFVEELFWGLVTIYLNQVQMQGAKWTALWTFFFSTARAYILMSTLLLISSSFVFGHLGERARWEHLSSDYIQPYSSLRAPWPRSQWGCQVKNWEKLVPCWTAETLHVTLVYFWLGFTLQYIRWIISWVLTTLHHFLCVRDFPSEAFRKNCPEFVETHDFK